MLFTVIYTTIEVLLKTNLFSMTCYILHHYKRQKAEYEDGKYIYFENNEWINICPYIFNNRFIHTFCKAFPLEKEIWNIYFWVYAKWNLQKTSITNIFCDIIFVAWEKVVWKSPNNLRWKHSGKELYYENIENILYRNHFKYCYDKKHHKLAKDTKRITLFADPNRSYQPQDENNNLIDIKPFLKGLYSQEHLTNAFQEKRWWGKKNLKLTDKQWETLYKEIENILAKKILWENIAKIDPRTLIEISY